MKDPGISELLNALNMDEITKIVAPNGYGKGVSPNPFSEFQNEWTRRKEFSAERKLLTEKIDMLFEPRFITPPETSECIESIITMGDFKQVLEVGMCSGFTTLHMIRSIVGKPGALVTSIDARPAHDRDFFEKPPISNWFRFVEGWTPAIIDSLRGQMFEFVFVDSDHSREHTDAEYVKLMEVTKHGTIFCFHDVPAWASPTNRSPAPVRVWLDEMVAAGNLRGVILPTCEQLDCRGTWGPGYPKECNPHLGVYQRM